MRKVSDVCIRTTPLKHLEPVLWEWIKIVKEWSSLFKNDAVWWYNERASLSSLAGAIWRSRGLVLEELSNPRQRKLQGQHVLKIGRADMVFSLRSDDYVLESKQCWISMNSDMVASKVQQALRKARKDAVSASSYGSQRVGATFVVPYAPKSMIDDIGGLVSGFYAEIENHVDYDASAFVFPRVTKDLLWKPEKAIYPGVILLLRVPRR